MDRRRFRRVLSLDRSAALIAEVRTHPVKALSIISANLGAAAACLSVGGSFNVSRASRLPVIGDVSVRGYSVCFFHYPILLSLQYALLDQAMPTVAKGILHAHRRGVSRAGGRAS